MSASTPSAAQSTARVLREEIVDGRLAPGDRLTELGLADRLQVSRSTVREALRSLETRGLVEVLPYLGARVTVLDADGARELYRVRAGVEPLLFERFCERATAAQLSALDEAMLSMTESARDSDDIRRVYRASDSFYEALFDGAGSWSIAVAVRAEHARLFAFRRSVLSEGVELERVRRTTKDVRNLMPLLHRREAQMVGNFSRRAMADDAVATFRMIRSVSG